MTAAPPITLAEFLLARIAEDEQVAEAAGPTAPMRHQVRTALGGTAFGHPVPPTRDGGV